MFDLLSSISSIILTALVSLIPIPIIIEKLLKLLNESKKPEIDITSIQSNSTKLTNLNSSEFLRKNVEFKKREPDELPKTQTDYRKKDVQQEDAQLGKYISTPPSPKPPYSDFNILYSLKTNTLKELYEKRNLDKSLKKISFILAVSMSIVGTVILFTGIIISLFDNKEIGWITTSSGAIIEVVASIYFWLVNRTMKEVKDNSKQLEKTEDLLTAIDLTEKISDISKKDEAYKNIINNLMNRDK